MFIYEIRNNRTYEYNNSDNITGQFISVAFVAARYIINKF